MYWRICSFPELEHLTEEERKRIVRENVPPRYMILIVVRSLGAGVMTLFVTLLVVGSSVGSYWRTMVAYMGQLVVGMIALLALVSVFAYQFQLISLRRHLRMYLEEVAKRQRLPMCLNCGYNLEGLKGQVCPECGKRIATPATGPTAS